MHKNTHRFTGVKELSRSLDAITKPIFRKRGFTENKILTDWNYIVGDTIGKCSTPQKLYFSQNKHSNGILYVEVYDSGTAMELTYTEPVILEKIAIYFGHKAVGKLKIIQKHGSRIENLKKSRWIEQTKLLDSKKEEFEELLSFIDDEDLKKALQSLGMSVSSG